jgi:antitoxin MazE
VQTKILKWGNSLGLRIPKAFAAEAGVEAGSDVELSIEDGSLRIRPRQRLRCRLDELLRDVSPANLHDEVSTGDAMGRETW